MLLKAYADDSGGNQPPVSVLAGWVATPQQWMSFAEDWEEVLRMSPRIQYFKYVEAMNFSGEFKGISEASRDEKLKLLIGVIEEHKLLGLASIIPHDVFHRHLGIKGSRALNVPYPILFVRLMARLQRHFLQLGGDLPKIDFVFDNQVDQEELALSGWHEFRRNASDEVRPMIGSPPAFLNDVEVKPLQAADLIAGRFRQMYSALLRNEPIPKPKWGKRGDELTVLTWTLNETIALYIKKRLFELLKSDGEETR